VDGIFEDVAEDFAFIVEEFITEVKIADLFGRSPSMTRAAGR
jgi:hypothetical protein